MTPELYFAARDLAYMLAHLASDAGFDQALEWAELSHALSRLFDPTLRMKNHEKLAEDIEVLRAAADFQHATSKVKAFTLDGLDPAAPEGDRTVSG
jgi:hypothetical protein